MAMVQSFVHMLIAARGLVLNISSISSDLPYLFAGVYSSTKGALNSYSRVLRMELRPFNVRVMVSMTGTVRSNFASHPEREMPTNSLYLPVRDLFLKRLTFSQNNATMPTDKCAASLVTQALKGEGWFGGMMGGTPDWHYLGGFSGLALAAGWLPRWVTERGIAIFFKLSSMTKRIRAAQAKRD